MKTIEEITTIVEKAGGYKLNVAKYPTWISENKDEGIQLEARKIKPFWVRYMQRVFGEPCSEVWQKVIDEIAGIPKPKLDIPINETLHLKKEEVPQQNDKTEQLPAAAGAKPESVGIIPDSLTMPLMEKWSKMKTIERMFMFQNTPEDMIETRPGPGGSKLKYVKGNKMIQELNIAFLFNWSSHIEEVKETETGYWVRGYITVEADNVSITRAAIGTADKHKGVNSEDVAKAAAMDMIKKAASSLGFNGDVYRGEV